jgi:hypothetical protein
LDIEKLTLCEGDGIVEAVPDGDTEHVCDSDKVAVAVSEREGEHVVDGVRDKDGGAVGNIVCDWV